MLDKKQYLHGKYMAGRLCTGDILWSAGNVKCIYIGTSGSKPDSRVCDTESEVRELLASLPGGGRGPSLPRKASVGHSVVPY